MCFWRISSMRTGKLNVDVCLRLYSRSSNLGLDFMMWPYTPESNDLITFSVCSHVLQSPAGDLTNWLVCWNGDASKSCNPSLEAWIGEPLLYNISVTKYVSAGIFLLSLNICITADLHMGHRILAYSGGFFFSNRAYLKYLGYAFQVDVYTGSTLSSFAF